jgi:membrane-associated phospholipid phosphatase
MRGWITAGVVFFVYAAAVAVVLPGLLPRRRWLVAGGAAAGLLLCLAAHAAPHGGILDVWILPPTLLLLGYWTSGLLFVAPMPQVENALEATDAFLRIDHLASRVPRWLAEVLELAYLGIYPIVPLALVLLLIIDGNADPDRFWTIVLATDFICFGCLPWLQSRPPRAFRSGNPWTSAIRRLNVGLLGKTSIGVNTLPSGHAAEALAATLLLSDAPWPLAIAMGGAALLVSVGAVFGRYHYAADVLGGWAVAFGVWLALS